MLNFIQAQEFYGQRPSASWTKIQDVDLLRGTYQYGYANYVKMRGDLNL